MKITNHFLLPFLVLSLITSLKSFSQQLPVFNGIYFYESLETVKTKIGDAALSHTVLTLEAPRFPLASTSETHLICQNLKTDNGTLAGVVFTFADDQLHYVEARGNAINTLLPSNADSVSTFMHYKVIEEKHVFGRLDTDQVWMLSDEALHPNLFAWNNPYLTANGPTDPNYSQTVAIPEYLEMGGGLDVLQPLLEQQSSFLYKRELDGSDPNAQLQLDCFGIEYAGFPRKIEARFGDGKLNVVWILTGKGEEDRLRQKLIRRYGAPVFSNADWDIFENWTIGLRKDKPEILLLTPELGQLYKKEYFKQ